MAKKVPIKIDNTPQTNNKKEISLKLKKNIDNILIKKLKSESFGIIEKIIVDAKGEPS